MQQDVVIAKDFPPRLLAQLERIDYRYLSQREIDQMLSFLESKREEYLKLPLRDQIPAKRTKSSVPQHVLDKLNRIPFSLVKGAKQTLAIAALSAYINKKLPTV